VRKKSRLFAVAELLRARRTGITAQQIADRFGVTLRTVYRDLEALQDAGMPIRADRGRGGGYALDTSYQLPPVNFTAREAALLVALARMASEQRLMPFPATLERAADKVRAALTTSAQRELLVLIKDLQIVGVPALPIAANVRQAIETAWFEGRPLRIVYEKRAWEHLPRVVKIRKLVFDRQVTFLNCVDL
jgi:predicted DNA-binding transcriptional regulator YafY